MESLGEMGCKDPLLEVAQALEEKALADEYFLKRKLYPNVDYYSGILLRAMGIPTSMFTVMFAMSRTVGWMAQWNEMISDGQMRITRPRQIYVGSKQREYQGKRTGEELDTIGELERHESNVSLTSSFIQRAGSKYAELPPVITR